MASEVGRRRRAWSEIGNFDKTMLQSEIGAVIQAITTAKMNELNLLELPEIKQAVKKRTISLWV